MTPALSLRARLSWCTHFWKAAAQQHHRAHVPLFRRHLAHAGQFTKLFAGIARDGDVLWTPRARL